MDKTNAQYVALGSLIIPVLLLIHGSSLGLGVGGQVVLTFYTAFNILIAIYLGSVHSASRDAHSLKLVLGTQIGMLLAYFGVLSPTTPFFGDFGSLPLLFPMPNFSVIFWPYIFWVGGTWLATDHFSK